MFNKACIVTFNPINRDESYSKSIFPLIPTVPIGTAILLAEGRFPPVSVTSTLSVRQIRNGKTSRLLEISTAVHSLEVDISVPSRDDPYQFEIRVFVEAWVVDPVLFSNQES